VNDEVSDVREPEESKPVSSAHAERLQEFLAAMDFFQDLKPDEVNALISEMRLRPFKRGQLIIRQGDWGDAFYVVCSGKLGVFRNGKRVSSLAEGTYFGEMALLDNIRRTASVMGENEGEVCFLSKSSFMGILLKNRDTAERIRQTADYRRAQNRSRALNSEAGWEP